MRAHRRPAGHRPPPPPAGRCDHRWRRLPTRWRSSSRGPPEASGADGILFLRLSCEKPSGRAVRHLDAICRATALAVIPYNRDNCLPAGDARPAGDGMKPDRLQRTVMVMSSSLSLFRQTSASESPISAACRPPRSSRCLISPPLQTYSSAVFNFIPRIAMRF